MTFPSPMLASWLLSSFRLYFGNHIDEISWMHLLCHIEKTLSCRRHHGSLSLKYFPIHMFYMTWILDIGIIICASHDQLFSPIWPVVAFWNVLCLWENRNIFNNRWELHLQMDKGPIPHERVSPSKLHPVHSRKIIPFLTIPWESYPWWDGPRRVVSAPCLREVLS